MMATHSIYRMEMAEPAELALEHTVDVQPPWSSPAGISTTPSHHHSHNALPGCAKAYCHLASESFVGMLDNDNCWKVTF
jgi:hypothetical protein